MHLVFKISCRTTLLTTQGLLFCSLNSPAPNEYSRSFAIKAVTSQQRASKLLESVLVLGTTDNKDRAGAIWWDAEMIGVLPRYKRGFILLSTLWYSKLAKSQERIYKVEFLKPIGAFKFLQNLYAGNDFNDSESI